MTTSVIKLNREEHHLLFSGIFWTILIAGFVLFHQKEAEESALSFILHSDDAGGIDACLDFYFFSFYHRFLFSVPSFPSWSLPIGSSKDIIIVQCGKLSAIIIIKKRKISWNFSNSFWNLDKGEKYGSDNCN